VVIAYPTGNMRGQERAGLPPNIDAGNKKVTFLDALKFRKAEKSPKNKKRPELSRVWWGRVPLWGKVGRMG
jgi:hypothetical protein